MFEYITFKRTLENREYIITIQKIKIHSHKKSFQDH